MRKNAEVLNRGLKRTVVALITAAAFVASALGFIKVSQATGYLAVLLFFASVAGMAFAFILMYAQGIATSKNKGDYK